MGVCACVCVCVLVGGCGCGCVSGCVWVWVCEWVGVGGCFSASRREGSLLLVLLQGGVLDKDTRNASVSEKMMSAGSQED